MSNKNPLLTEGVLIGIASLLGYILPYAYQLGFTSHFFIPNEFIDIGLNEILFTVTFLTLIFGATIILSLNFSELSKKPKFKNLFWIVISLLLLLGILLIKSTFFIIPFILFFVLSFAFLLSDFFQYIFIKQDILHSNEPIKETRTKTNTFFDQYLLEKSFPLFFLLFLLITFTFPFGNVSAQTQRNFLIAKTKPKMAVLAIYDNSIICAPFDRKNKTVEKRFFIINKDSEDIPILELEKVGPLKANKPK